MECIYLNCLRPRLTMLRCPNAWWDWWGSITCCSVLKNRNTSINSHLMQLYRQTDPSCDGVFLCFCETSPITSRLWKQHRFTFTRRRQSDETDRGKHVYGDSANVVIEAGRAIRVPANRPEWKQTERRLRGGRVIERCLDKDRGTVQGLELGLINPVTQVLNQAQSIFIRFGGLVEVCQSDSIFSFP